MKFGLFPAGIPGRDQPGKLRFSSAVSALRNQGALDTLAELERLRELHGKRCPTHGELKDPILAILGEQVAFICPWCSGPEILAAWEAEGRLS